MGLMAKTSRRIYITCEVYLQSLRFFLFVILQCMSSIIDKGICEYFYTPVRPRDAQREKILFELILRIFLSRLILLMGKLLVAYFGTKISRSGVV